MTGTDPHRCLFVIPVEWQDFIVTPGIPTLRRKVTKLRCECGKEIDR